MANDVTVKNASGVTETMKATDNGANKTPHQNVDVIVPGVGATHLGKSFDAAAGASDTGVAALGRRKDAGGSPVSADGDYTTPTFDAQNRQWTRAAVEPMTSGGCSSYSRIASGTSSDEAVVKNSAGQVYGIHVRNRNAAERFLKVYDISSAPTLGSGTPKRRIAVPGNSVRDLTFPVGIEFSTGVAIAMTTGISDGDANRVTADDLIVEIDFK